MEHNGSSDEDEGKSEESTTLRRWIEERERYDEIAEYIRQVDEILDFIKPFPRNRLPDPGQENRERGHHLDGDHLENLVKLVERLRDLKEKDARTNERTQYLKDLKKLRERKKLLKCEAEAIDTPVTTMKANRGRSKSVNADEIGEERARRQRFASVEDDSRGGHGRKMSSGSHKADKSKVSKWTKVKEAFRWEKASMDGKRREESHYLQVPLQDKTPDSLSDSPVSGQVSGSSSVGAPSTICLAVSSGYSGEHSSEGHSTSSGYGIDGLPPPPPPPPPPLPTGEDDFLLLPIIQDLSSSSSSEKLDELLTYSELLAKGNDRSELIGSELFDSAFQSDQPGDDVEARRSKSLDGDTVLGPSPSLVQHLSKESLKSSKTHKTAWGKVKDIIQTRKDSLKKKPKKRTGEKTGEGFSFQSGLDLVEQSEDQVTSEDKPKDVIKPKIEVSSEATDETLPPSSHPEPAAHRRLTPVLTITLPSTEELRSISSNEAEAKANTQPQTPQPEDKEYFDDIPKYEKSKTGSYHRFSKWSKVKRAFLTNSSRSPEYVPDASSAPSSPNKQISFFSDIESDELSSGDWTDYKTQSHDKSAGEGESLSFQQDDIQKHYVELHQKLSHEFDQKLREWERLRETKKHEVGLQKQKSEDWDKIPKSSALARQRDSMTIPLPKIDDLSPEFKKKLDEWKKIKKSQTMSAVVGTGQASSPKEEGQQNFKMRIGEWQKWRPRGGHHKMTQSEEFAKKLEEWQRIKGGTMRRSRSQSERGKEEVAGRRTPSPRLRRKSSKGGGKKGTSSGKSSGTESLSGSLKEKDGRSRKVQKEKDLVWLEKELHKIERGKMRLEREREKFLEREARLEKMKRTMGTTSPTQEVLVKTPTGFIKFEGISQKFTKKLYEWEKARGIAPEASTFALLEECATVGDDSRSNGMSLQRSKSMGSVMEVSSSSAVPDMPHHPSSLSLNDVDDLDVGRIDESRASSDPNLAQDEDEPQAIIVDVEDVVEETAAFMSDVPRVTEEVPVYSYAPTEVTQLIDSSGSDGESEFKIIHETGMTGPAPRAIEKMDKDIVSNNDDRGNEEGQKSRQQKLATVAITATTTMTDQAEAVSRVHELSSQLLCLAEKLEVALSDRSVDEERKIGSALYARRRQQSAKRESETQSGSEPSAVQDLVQLPSLITNKVLELKSGLDVLSATASPAPSDGSNVFDFVVPGPRAKDVPASRLHNHYHAEPDTHLHRKQLSPEVIKNRIREKISLMHRMTTEARPRNFPPLFVQLDQPVRQGEDDDDDDEEVRDRQDENVVVVRKTGTKGREKKLLKTRRITDTTIAYKQVVEDNQRRNEDGDHQVARKTPVNVFVPTTRKIISPIRTDSRGTTSSILSYVIDDISPAEEMTPRKREEPTKPQAGAPPLPSSPPAPRKGTSPGIRMMIAKYNQKIEGETAAAPSSPVSWRSPILDRKTTIKPDVQKSASVGLVPAPDSPPSVVKSSSLGLVVDATPSTLRALRLKQAKEEFLSRGPGWSSVPTTPTAAEPPDNRLSHASVGSESSAEADPSLMKSASAGAINDAGREEDEGRGDGDAMRGAPKAAASSKFGISSIRSRLRRARAKRSGRGGAVSTLCRQSLLLEVPVATPAVSVTSKSCPSSPVLERSRSRTDDAMSWIRNPGRMFRGKETKPNAP